jgi:hypothetical protein
MKIKNFLIIPFIKFEFIINFQFSSDLFNKTKFILKLKKIN